MFDENAHNKQMDNLKILPAVIAKYIPEELRQHIDLKNQSARSELEYIQGIFDRSNNKLRMYENADSLLENLLIYMHFPLRRKIFPIPMGEYRHVVLDAYYTLKGELLYCKQEYLFNLQSCVYSNVRSLFGIEMPAELIEYMKKHEERLSGCYEFFVFKPGQLEGMPIAPYREALAYQQKNFVEVFDGLISEYPWIFLPNNETKDERATAVVRVFNDRCGEYVMESELFNAINFKNPDRKPLKCEDDNEGFLKTLDYAYVLETYGDEITDIDFTRWSLVFADHLAVPVVTPTGEHCVRAADALLEVLTLSIKALKVFQKIKRNTCHMVPKFIAFLKKYFPPDIKYRYFITFPLIEKMKSEMKEFWKQFKDKPAKEVRDVGPNGFTAEDLRKELKYLGYTEIFPEISTEARRVYGHCVERQKKQLTTSDMFRAIETCVVAIILNRFPCLQEFLHRQKYCIHAGPICKPCLKGFKDAAGRIEAEKKAEHAAMSSVVTFTTDEVIENKRPENTEGSENSEESVSKTAVSEAHSMKLTKSEDLERSIESSSEHHSPISIVTEKYEKIDELSKTEESLNQENEDFKATVNSLQRQLGEEIKEVREALVKSEAPRMEETEKFLNLDRKINCIEEEKDSRIQELELEISRITLEKNVEIEKFKKQQALVVKEKKKEIEQLKRNASKFANEIEKLTVKIAEKEAAENRMKRSNEELHEKLQKFNSNLQEITRKHSHLEADISDKNRVIEQLKRNAFKSADEIKKLTAQIAEKEVAENRLKQPINELHEKLRKSDSNLQETTKKHSHLETEITDKNRIILELQKSAEKHVSEQERARELETLVSKFRGLLDEVSPPEPTEKPECLICFYEMRPDEKTLKCEHCRKVVHLECASKWLKIHRSCAHCRREQLDPNEFPSLQ